MNNRNYLLAFSILLTKVLIEGINLKVTRALRTIRN